MSRPALDHPEAPDAADVADVVAAVTARLQHPEPLVDDTGPRSHRWWAQSLTHGAAGIAILHAVVHDEPAADSALLHRWLSAAVAADVSAAPGTGAWFGLPAVAFAFTHAAPDGYYGAARAIMDDAVRVATRDRLDAARDRIARRMRPQLKEFDLVNGLTGIGGYLLQRDPADPQIADVLSYLVELTEPVRAADWAGATVPGWWTADPPSSRPDVHGGHSDQGAAHGIAGPLSLLALAARAGICVPGQRVAMHRILDWFDTVAKTAGTDGLWWPQRVTWPERIAAVPSFQTHPGRPSWCYSTPGIARALQLAALALGEPDRCRAAERALTAAVTDPDQLGKLSDVSLCHGWAGAALTVWCAARDSTAPGLASALPALTSALTDALHDALHETSSQPSTAPAGLLQGLAGAALTLHGLTVDDVGGWARCLLLH